MTLLERMDRLPMTGLHKTIWAVCALGWFFDGFEQMTPSATLPFIYPEFHLTALTSGLILSAYGWGFLIGTFVFGYLADRVGRRAIFQIDLLLFSLGGGMRIFATGWVDLFIYTMITTIGVSGMYAVDNAYMAEFLPPKSRGKWQEMMILTQAPAFIVATQLIYVVPTVPTLAGLPFGWRLIILGGAIPVFLIFWARRILPVIQRKSRRSCESRRKTRGKRRPQVSLRRTCHSSRTHAHW
jgi:putative MFS transporter